MGMYTELHLKIKLNPTGQAIITHLHDFKAAGIYPRWPKIAEEMPYVPEILEWAKVGRSSMIPYGTSAYFDDPYSTLKDGIWDFRCNLKNYETEIETFLRLMVPILGEIVSGHVHYEEHSQPTDIFDFLINRFKNAKSVYREEY